TQNIDNLHQEAGSKEVYEFHGNSRRLICTGCGRKKTFAPSIFTDLPPCCEHCGEVLKPDYVFFGEPIPEPARSKSFREAKLADVFLVIGTEGEVQPAAMIPLQASKNGAKIIEVNTGKSNYTNNITDIYLQGKATEIMGKIGDLLM
ncbi:MAG: SIR2 family NAD-dependent protein deacylase, partial [Halanaerobiaceae bacterium]